MFLRCHPRKKNGKLHGYWSVTESRPAAHGEPAQRQIVYFGEINDSQDAAWRKTIAVFDERAQRFEQIDRLLPSGAIAAALI